MVACPWLDKSSDQNITGWTVSISAEILEIDAEIFVVSSLYSLLQCQNYAALDFYIQL